jgi:hypothetical protein
MYKFFQDGVLLNRYGITIYNQGGRRSNDPDLKIKKLRKNYTPPFGYRQKEATSVVQLAILSMTIFS